MAKDNEGNVENKIDRVSELEKRLEKKIKKLEKRLKE